MPLAEGPTIDGGTLALILGALLLLLCGWIAAVAVGFRSAPRAGRGSRPDAIRWAIAGFVELLPGLLAGPNVLLVPGLVVLGGQALLYFRAKGGSPTA